ncbi:putative reverse transcriptase domain-containing protein [Tanacetum coccineum]
MTTLAEHMIVARAENRPPMLKKSMNGAIKKSIKKRGNVGEPSKDKNGKDDNKRTRTGNAFATTINPVRRENTGAVPKNGNLMNARNPTVARGACYKCGSTDHVSYKIKIASGQLIEIDKVIRGCKLELEGHVFDINLIPFGSGSFDVIIGMDWLSDHKAEIICCDKVVRIPLVDGKVLRVLGEKPEEKVFPDDLSGLPPIQEIEFWIDLIPGAIPKCKTFNWDEEKELAFQTLKDKLCNAPIIALPDGPEDFVVYCDASGLGLGCVLMQRDKVMAYASSQKELNMRQHRWIELFSDYDYRIRYYLGKENVVADALSRKEKVKPNRVRAKNMTIQSSIKDRILAAQKEACEESVGL